jgi:energy-coupling factor transporter ATP-binding protein EcfA2
MIRFDEFSWRFTGAPTDALRDLSLHVRPGELVAVAGPSGSGKTTLALAMCGLLVGRQAGDARGRVRVGGHDVGATPLHEIAETIGLVQQNPEAHFATLTVDDELAFGMENRCLARDTIRHACADAMKLLAIEHLRGRSLATLSGGEKQRVAVASMIAGKPQALVLDEPTASLDPQASRDLFRALADLCRRTGLTVVIIEHKLAQLLPLKPRLICLEEGQVIRDVPAAAADAKLPSWLGELVPARFAPTRVASTPHADEPLVNLSDVTVAPDGCTILDRVSLRVHAGEVVAVLGPNGGGKSTLLHCLMGLLRPAQGSIRVCDVPVSPSAVSRLARQVGLVFQNADHQLAADTVWREALYAVRNLKLLTVGERGRAARLLEAAGLADRRDDHPYRLSWGQKRRLNVISAVLHRPRLLLLDEPFAGQDWENATFLLDVIDEVVNGGRAGEERAPSERGACLMATHDARIVARSCTRVVFLSGGRVVVDAPVPEAFRRLSEMGHDAYVLPGSRQPSALSPQPLSRPDVRPVQEPYGAGS